MRRILLILASVLLLAACEKQSELVTLMAIDNVDWEHETVDAGTNVHIKITAESQSSTVQRIILTSSDSEHKDITVLDSTFAMPTKKTELSYYYTLPDYTADTISVKFLARSYDQKGNTMSYSITLRVVGKEITLKTYDMITLYSAASGGKSAFSLANYQPVYLDKDTNKVAFYDVLNEEELTQDSPSCIWHSESGLLFTRSEGFNFSEATLKSLPDSTAWQRDYIRSSTVKNLKADDVLLFGKAERVIGAIKILSIHDEPGTDTDRYIFSMKVRPD